MLPALVSHVNHTDRHRLKVDKREVRTRRLMLEAKEQRQRVHLKKDFEAVTPRFMNSPRSPRGADTVSPIHHERRANHAQTVVGGDESRIVKKIETHKRLQLPRHVVEEHHNFMAVSDQLLSGRKQHFVVAESVTSSTPRPPTVAKEKPRPPLTRELAAPKREPIVPKQLHARRKSTAIDPDVTLKTVGARVEAQKDDDASD